MACAIVPIDINYYISLRKLKYGPEYCYATEKEIKSAAGKRVSKRFPDGIPDWCVDIVLCELVDDKIIIWSNESMSRFRGFVRRRGSHIRLVRDVATDPSLLIIMLDYNQFDVI